MNTNPEQYIHKSATEDTIDILKILKRFLEFWPYFIVVLFISFISAYLFNKYYTPVYRGISTVLIKDDRKSSIASNNLISNLDMFGSQQSLQNEIAILNSYSLNKKTVEDLNLFVGYFVKKSYRRTSEVYKNLPFSVVFDTTKIQAVDIPITVGFEKDKILISYEVKSDVQFFDFMNWRNITKNNIPKKKIEKHISFFELYTDDLFSFMILPNQVEEYEKNNFAEFEVVLNNPDKVIQTYRNRLNIEPINKDATIVLISLTDFLPLRAREYLNMLISNYINMGLNEKNLIAVKTIEFIDEQLKSITDTLSVIEIQLEDFRTENKITDLSYQGQAIFQKLQNLEYERSIESMKVGYYKYLLNYIQSENSGKEIIAPSAIGINDALLSQLIIELSQLYVTREQLELTASATNPYMIELDVKINTLRKSITENVTNIYANAKFNLTAKDKQLAEIQTELATLPGTERELISINRMFTVNDQIYTFLLEKRAEAAIAKASSISDNKIIDTARIDAKIKPKTKQNYLLALLLGIILPAAFIVIFDLIKNTVNDLSEIEALTSVAIVGNIIHYEDEKVQAIQNPDATILESFRAIRTNLDFFIPQKEKKIITLTSMTSGEGKSFCSFHLAIVFALAKKKTLLIGADLRKPDVGKFFNKNISIGLSNFLINNNSWSEIVFQSQIKGLDFIPAGPVPPNPAELLSPEHVSRIIEQIGEYDIVIFDTSPIGIFADAAYIIKSSDIVLFVSRYNYSKKAEFRNMNNIVEKLNIKHAGLLCNDMQKKDSKYYYNKYYYYNKKN
jgi:tyrosine-protein kinase Etk/Wzc